MHIYARVEKHFSMEERTHRLLILRQVILKNRISPRDFTSEMNEEELTDGFQEVITFLRNASNLSLKNGVPNLDQKVLLCKQKHSSISKSFISTVDSL